ncbi:MAG TPA: TetR-like C-terminal domain-containing protein [Candidatus Binataceae bacterium]|nr:TetR-like C-terminal domain-containing protein [Candidatus Binataceae bacterium]
MGTRAGLSREAVVAAAAAIADREGVEALTLARLAAELQVKPPSLFNHVAGLPALRRELRLLALRELCDAVTRASIGKSRADGVRALARAYREFVKKHPGIYAETLSAAEDDAEAADIANRIIEVCSAVMSGYQLKRDEAIHALRAMRSIGHGFASLEAAHGFGIPVNIDESYEWFVDNFVAGLEAAHARAAGPATRARGAGRQKRSSRR